MIEFIVEQSELTCQWRFKDSFIPIPAPGDEDFAVLFRSLSPFGATLSSITFEDEPQSFDEERMVIPLFNGQIRLRLGYASFDFVAQQLVEGGEDTLASLIKTVVPTLERLGADAKQGQARFSWQAFIRFNNGDIDEFLKQHLRGYQNNPQLTPDAFAYFVNLRSGSQAPVSRVVLARSSSPNFPAALFVEMTLEYTAPGEVNLFVKRVQEDWQQTMAALDLKLNYTF